MHERILVSTTRTVDALQRWWSGLALRGQFTLAAAPVLLAGMTAIGLWVGDRVGRAVTFNTAAAIALYMESSVASLVQELATSDRLPQATLKKLDQLLAHCDAVASSRC